VTSANLRQAQALVAWTYGQVEKASEAKGNPAVKPTFPLVVERAEAPSEGGREAEGRGARQDLIEGTPAPLLSATTPKAGLLRE